MTRPAVSVVIVSRNRPESLSLCLSACALLYHPHFEIIVVADESGRGAARAHRLAPDLTILPCEEPNISIARNIGLAHAVGDVVAFIDDDAVPEPLWLWHLSAAFLDPEVVAATGYTRGRNGITFQSKAAMAHADGATVPFDLGDDAPQVIRGVPGCGVKTEGTNMAFRRVALIALGGFDPIFAFYLDETDVNLRLAELGAATAIVPLAQVHHRMAESAHRRADRVPAHLTSIGVSLAVFLRKHAAPDRRAEILNAGRTEQRCRVLSAMRAGLIGPGEVRRLMSEFEDGITEGLHRPLTPVVPPVPVDRAFHPVAGGTGQGVTLAGRLWARRQNRRRAEEAARASGGAVTLFLLSRTAVFHRSRFVLDGYWEQRGGLFGRSTRENTPVFRLWRFSSRIARETQRLNGVRFVSGWK